MPAVIISGQNGMKFTTSDMDYDLYSIKNCASVLGGGFWYSRCSLWASTVTPVPGWYNRVDSTWPGMNTVHMMIKVQ